VKGTATLTGPRYWLISDEMLNHDRITITGDVNLILANGAHLQGGGINVAEDNTLTIWAQSTDGKEMGKLTAQGGIMQAGIGGNIDQSGGTITINGGTVEAAGGPIGAGIGGGADGNGGVITINGGTVEATGGWGGAGIGGGFSGAGGAITISGKAQVGPVDDGILIIGPGNGGSGGSTTIKDTPTIIGDTLLRHNAIVYDDATLTVENDATLTIVVGMIINDGSTLIIPTGATLANNGVVQVKDGSTVTVSGTVSGNLINGANVSAPSAASVTSNSVTLADEELLLATTGQDLEFAFSTDNTAPEADSDVWQTGLTFGGLNPNTGYYFFARSAADGRFDTGAASEYVQIRTTSIAAGGGGGGGGGTGSATITPPANGGGQAPPVGDGGDGAAGDGAAGYGGDGAAGYGVDNGGNVPGERSPLTWILVIGGLFGGLLVCALVFHLYTKK
jgi:hypothetical protein